MTKSWFYPLDCIRNMQEINEGNAPKYMTSQKCILEDFMILNGLINLVLLLYVFVAYSKGKYMLAYNYNGAKKKFKNCVDTLKHMIRTHQFYILLDGIIMSIVVIFYYTIKIDSEIMF